PSCGDIFEMLYGHGAGVREKQTARYEALALKFAAQFPERKHARVFSAPGRAEIGGNHTDHQSGRVLAASVNLDTLAIAAPNGGTTVCIHSEGYAPIKVELADLSPLDSERGNSAAVVRGCAARMKETGRPIGGFDAVVTSDVLGGSGLSSSASFEVTLCRIFDNLFGGGDMAPDECAIISQHAENVYFGKPCGLLDQMGCAVGGLVAMDFIRSEPAVEKVAFDFEAAGYTLAVVNTGGDHGDLTGAYASIPADMGFVAAFFEKERLRFVDRSLFEENLPSLVGKISDQAILRAMHFFDENDRVPQQVAALQAADLPRFFELINASGDSSMKLLQNIYVDPNDQPITLALALSERMLRGSGAWRVHGGGFAGTILAFVPLSMYQTYRKRMDQAFGAGACQPLNIRPVGTYELIIGGING
ncbi:MAG: galactokinase, partial [Clostridia bacterium]|nr:galactokinase [Clostridia bacterium]